MSKIKTVIVVGKKTPTYYCYYSSPVGNLLLAGDALGLSRIQFETSNNQVKIESEWQENYQFFNNVIGQLCEYFDKTRKSFDLKLNPKRTPFQQQVWQQLLAIEYGHTRSYYYSMSSSDW